MIDPLETVIQFALADPGLARITGGRIASKHRFGSDWTAGQAALVIKLDGGTPDNYVPVQSVRLEITAYGGTPREAYEVYQEFLRLSRGATTRQVIETQNGRALLLFLTQAISPTFVLDETLQTDLVLSFFYALVAEDPVP